MAVYEEPYVEDYNSELSEAIPLTRRQTTKRASGLSNSISADSTSYEPESTNVSDSGYSSHAEASTPGETPPPKSATPSTPSRNQARSSRSPSNPALPPFTRPSSKSFSRAQASAGTVPRNIPSSYNTVRREYRESSPSTSTGGADDCDCADCGKPSKPMTSSPSRNSGVWPASVPEHPYQATYSSSPSSSSYASYPYPSKYDGYSESAPTHAPYATDPREGSSSRRERSSTQAAMPPPPRPLSTFAGTTATTSSHSPSGSWSQSTYSSSGYAAHTSSPTPAAPAPSTTCPPTYSSSMYPPPPIDTSVHSSTHSYDYSPYAPPSASATYGHSYTPDPYSQSPVPPAPNYYQEPSYHSDSHHSDSYHSDSYHQPEYSSLPPPPAFMGRRGSMRASASAAVLDSSEYYTQPEYTHPQVAQHRERRSSNRVHSSERPTSWYSQSQFQDVPSRSVSVPPAQSDPQPAPTSSRRMATPQPIRRRDSSNSQGSGSHSSRLPSSLSRSMETCAIDDEPPSRSSRHGHSHHRSSGYYEHHQHGAVTRRDAGTLMQNSHSNRSSDSGSSGYSHDSGREELVVLDSDEPFTMRYPAGVPVKLSLNGGHSPRTISLGNKNDNFEYSIGYKYVQQRQQQLHAQLSGGTDHYDRRTTSADYSHRSYERQRV
ncbi:hypothetical protein DFP73DRAFT_267908 [Morchella snyderi]|nr:hypothetical protein DFP73DRAFT_267908 [Morchella snyderi]